MPIYEYTCRACGADFEKLVKMSASAPPCPTCSSEEVKKRISRASFHLKGSGWYKDGYGLKRVPSQENSDWRDGGNTGSSGEGAEAKPNKAGGEKAKPAAAEPAPAPAPTAKSTGDGS